MQHDDEPDEAPTPRESCSLQRAPIFAGRARIAVQRLELAKRRYLGIQSPREVNLDKARACSTLVRELVLMQRRFDRWVFVDPGMAERITLAHRLRDIELQTDALVPSDWA